MNVKTLWWLAALLTLVLLALVGEKYRSQLATPTLVDTAFLSSPCDLRQSACTARFADNNSVELTLAPNTIPLLETLAISVKFKNKVEADKVEVDFVGINMDMGFNRTKLMQHNELHYQGEAILPICTLQRMEWEARVLVHTPDGIKMAAFPFHTTRNTGQE